MNKRISFILCVFLLSCISATSQTLQQVTDSGNTTTNSINISNAQGLSIGVDASTGYTTKAHFIRPLNAGYRTVRFDCSSVDASGGWEFYNSSLNKSLMYISQGGNVGIGVVDTKGFKLAVGGSVIAERVKVALQSGWPDYVFDSIYTLPSLEETECYIKKFKHLAEIPSAKELEKNGLDLGENQAKLLKKIEELTLYLIDLNKKLESQQQLISDQQQLITEQGMQIEELRKNQ
ncbi:hypothetical protein F0L74_23050 [Chitinophaga agrisoli]|uniref:Uncharacterized protein n=1 Tax=Chitinophaga agrisoli TaxID=2607653 RepID=A0A5B2VHN9_9BACT|nr:hypothetical protein [Chitinophaga agrisoli]KAA2239093.1 hypothetical protein F0L74_23050 [Chitinophaga agrisoli]